MKEEINERFAVHDAIISWATIIWAIASIGLICYFSGLNQVTFTIMTFGQLFLVLGVIMLVRKQSSGVLLTISGLSCIILPAINEWGYMFNSNIPANSIFFPTLISTAITVLGIALMVGPGVLENMAERRCKVRVKAEVVDLKSVELADGKMAFAPVYSYEYNNEVYVKTIEKYKTTNIPEIGSKLEFSINEKKPEDVYIPASKASKMLIYIVGAGFFISGFGMILTILYA